MARCGNAVLASQMLPVPSLADHRHPSLLRVGGTEFSSYIVALSELWQATVEIEGLLLPGGLDDGNTVQVL